MTVAALTPSVSYLEDGVTLGFPAPFRYIDPTHLLVQRVLVSGAVSTLAHGADWSATAGPTDAGGTVTLVATVAGATLIITRRTPRAQATDYTTNDAFPAESHELALDRAMLVDQEQDVALADILARALLLPVADPASGALPDVASRAARYLAFDLAGNPIVVAGTVDNGVLQAVLAQSSGSSQIGFLQAGAGAVARTVQDKLRDLAISPEDYRLAGYTDQQALAAALAVAASSGRAVYLGGPDKTWTITATHNITLPNVVIYGAGCTVVMDHSALGFVTPMMHVQSTATGFKSWGIKWNHAGSGVAQPTLGNQVAFVYTNAIILGADEFKFSGEVYNSWDNGIGVGRVAFTGTGTVGDPVSAVQTVASPQSWVVSDVYGENCGCGEHNYAPASEYGKKGGLVNVLTGADGVVSGISGKNNYNGLIIDYGGGAEASIGPCAFTGTLRDATYPNNGSGIDYFIGAAQVIAPDLKSDNAARMGLAITDTAGAVMVNARIHASGEEGAIIDGGSITGVISVSAAGQNANNTYDAVIVRANNVNTQAHLQVTVLAAPSGNKHRFAYRSEEGGGFKIRGSTHLVADAGITGIYNRTGSEALTYSGTNDTAIYGRVGLGTEPIANTTSDIFFGSDVTLIGGNRAIMMNVYYDLIAGAWKYAGNGPGMVLKLDAATAAVTLSKAPINAGGAGAAATLTIAATW